MPPRVYRGKSAFEYHPKEGGAIRLCSLDSKKSVVWSEYEKYAAIGIINFKKLYSLFEKSPQFNSLAPRTQKDYAQYYKAVMPVFGHVMPDKITTPHIRRYMDKRGKNAPARANKELSWINVVISWGRERGYNKTNPCTGIKRFKTTDRDRYIEDWEYLAVYEIAPVPIKVAMDISYLCAARTQDIISLTRKQILDIGIYIKQGKTGKKQIKLWSDALRDVIALAKMQPGVKSATYVVHNKKGKRYTEDGFKSIWQGVIRKAIKEGLIKNRFTFHDIKAKGISDYEQGDKQLFSGHKTRRAMEVYNRKIQEVPALEPKKN